MLTGLSAYAQTNKVIGKCYTIDKEGRNQTWEPTEGVN